MSSPVRVGLIGCGRIARLVHLGVLTRLAEIDLIALAEPILEARVAAQAQAPQARLYVTYQDLLAQPDIEAVVIALPSGLHAEAARAALAAGKHIYLEKPLATTVAEAETVVADWRASGLVGMIGFNYRFNPLYQAAREVVQSGRLGQLVAVRSVFSTSARQRPAWKESRRTGGGVLLDHASHHIDLVYHWFGQSITRIAATLHSRQAEDDSAVVTLELADGLVIQSFFSTCAVEEDRFEVYGQAGKLSVDRYLSLSVDVTGPTLDHARLKWLGRRVGVLANAPQVIRKLAAPGREPSYELALAHFAQAVRAGRPASPDLADGLRVQSVIAAAEESARTGRTVEMDNARE